MTRSDTGDTATDKAVVARLEAEHLDWGVWVSDTGRWWASRRRQLNATEQAAGKALFLRADGAPALAELLAEQEAVDHGTA
jgi:hypothetical protein